MRDIIEIKRIGGNDVFTIGKIDIEIYKCVAEDIVTDEVIITDERIQHIKADIPMITKNIANICLKSSKIRNI